MKPFIAFCMCAALLIGNALAAKTINIRSIDEVSERFMQNPFSLNSIGDPMIVRTQDEYLTFATGSVTGFSVWHNSDLRGEFTREKAIRSIHWSASDNWAPEVHEYRGKWVMLYTCRWKANGSLRVGIAFADEPQGPYKDPLEAPLFDFGYAAIDATLFCDDNGTPYLIYSRDCSENVVDGRHESHLYGMKLAEDLLSVAGEPILLMQPDDGWETASGDYRWNEGPAVVKRDGRYYLFYSANGYADNMYSVGVAVSEDPLGPYIKQSNNPILAPVYSNDECIVSGPGHNQFFTVGDELFTSYHTHTYPSAPSGDRQLCIDRAGFHEDGTAFICGPTTGKQLRPLTDLGLTNHIKTAQTTDTLLTDGDICVAPSSGIICGMAVLRILLAGGGKRGYDCALSRQGNRRLRTDHSQR